MVGPRSGISADPSVNKGVNETTLSRLKSDTIEEYHKNRGSSALRSAFVV